MSKGSAQRPTDMKLYGDNYDRIFKRDKESGLVEFSKAVTKDIAADHELPECSISKEENTTPKENRKKTYRNLGG
jgi:hypothetical protein